MKWLIGFLTTMSVACSGCTHTDTAKVNDTHMVVLSPPDSHLAWCGKSTEDCFDAASTLCAPEHTRRGKFHQVPEADMSFPAMIQEGNGWRMLFVCDAD
jgi:hypothetical protein